MLGKIYKVDLLTVDNQRISVHIEGNSVQEVAKRLRGNRITFLPKGKENRHSFTLYSQIIAKIQYETVADTGFNTILIYDVFGD